MLIHLSHLKVATVLAAGVLFAATVYLLEGKPSPSTPNVQSQQGTQVDIASDRDTFEYFLSTLGERSLDDIQVQYARFANTLSFGEQQQALFEKYQNYRQALGELPTPSYEEINVDLLTTLHRQMKALQAAHFTEDEQQRLFYEENLTREMAIRKLELDDSGLDPESKQALWQAELDRLPPNTKESYRNAALINHLNTLKNREEPASHSQVVALIGEEAALRLQAYEQEEAAFQQGYSSYLIERETLLGQDHLTEHEREDALQTLRKSYFGEDQHRRVEALDAMQLTQTKS